LPSSFIVSAVFLAREADAPADAFRAMYCRGSGLRRAPRQAKNAGRCWMYSETVGNREGTPRDLQQVRFKYLLMFKDSHRGTEL